MTEKKAGRYQLLEELGRGAMGVVYKGFDPTIGRTVAVKTMKLTEEGTGLQKQELIQRFQNETRAAGLLTHPNIVVIYDAGEDPESGLFFITMEYIQGQSLMALLDRKQVFPISRIMKLMEQACGALNYAHEHKVVHRDIKPANIMLASDDTVKITDFGTAKILQLGTTMTGQIVGTPSYMSPEQVKGRPIDGRSDIFSLGVVLYELVTGEKPFPGQNVTTVIYKIVHEDPISPIELDSSVHPGLNEVISKSLAKDPDERYQTCREFFEDIRNFRDFGTGRNLGSTVVMTGRPREVIEASQPAPPPRPQEKSPTLSGVPIPPVTPPAAPPVAAEPPPAPAPRTSKTLPPLPYVPPEKKPEPKKSGTNIWVVLILLAVIGGAGYFLWPRLQESFGLGSPASPPAESAAPSRSAEGGAAQPAPSEKPAENKAAETRAPEPKAAETSARAKVTPPETKSQSEPPSVNAAALQKRIEQRLARGRFAGRVRVDVSGNSVTLTGNLKAIEKRRLLQQMPPLPAGIRLEDRIEVADAGGAEGEERPRTAPGLGEVEVVTDVMGARAVLRGPQGNAQECRTPCRFEDLPPGRYTMDVEQAGYRPEKRILQVNAGQIKEEKVTFRPYSSGIAVVTRPANADIYIDGRKYAAQTPTTIVLPPGRYTIRVQKAGYQEYQQSVELVGDSLQQLNVPLVEAPASRRMGLVEVRTVPPGADIIVDGISTGRKTPFTLELPAGEHTIGVVLRGKGVQRRVTVQAGTTSALNEILPQ